ncbi:MAG: ribulose-phosphate 3-epimerase [Candidatus Thermoplasmatota archaeon]
MNKVLLGASILSADFSNLAKDINEAENAGVDFFHIDVMDGLFVPNITIGPPVVKSIRKTTKLLFDTHLMIEKPENFIEDFVDAGSQIITVHAEVCPHLHKVIEMIKEKGAKAGVALNPATPLGNLEVVMDELELILIMSVNPGFSGQKFIERTIPKIERTRKIFRGKIEVDGGVSPENVNSIVKAGANMLVAGNSIFKDRKIKENILKLRKAID